VPCFRLWFLCTGTNVGRDSRRRLPLPPPDELYPFIPEYCLEDICDFLMFAARYEGAFLGSKPQRRALPALGPWTFWFFRL
jgi:hypothetical protein